MMAMALINVDLRMLSEVKAKLASADALADVIRDKALRDYSSDEPYETASALSSRIMHALSLVETMIAEARP